MCLVILIKSIKHQLCVQKCHLRITVPEVGLFLALPSILGAGLVPAALDCCVGGRKGRGGRGGGVTTPDMADY